MFAEYGVLADKLYKSWYTFVSMYILFSPSGNLPPITCLPTVESKLVHAPFCAVADPNPLPVVNLSLLPEFQKYLASLALLNVTVITYSALVPHADV